MMGLFLKTNRPKAQGAYFFPLPYFSEMAMASKEFSLMPISYPDPATVTKANDQPATDATSLFISFLVKVIFFEPGQL